MELSKILEEHGIPAAMKAACEAFSDVIGPPAKATGQLLASPIHMMQAELILRFIPRYKRLVEQAGMSQRQVPFRIWFSILQNVSIEEDNSMQERWAALLIDAANPDSEVDLPPSFLETLKQLSPQEAGALDFIYTAHAAPNLMDLLTAEGLSRELSVGPDDAGLILANLARLGLITDISWEPGLRFDASVYGTQFVSACGGASIEKK